MRIVEVISRKDLMRFVKFPDELYRGCPQYVPALHVDQIRSLTKCASLKYCERVMWLALTDEGKVCGRICGMINPRYNERYNKKCARFGWFDTVNDFEVAKALIETASEWARSKGMTQIHGPLYYNTLGKQGMLVEGFGNIPQFNTLYNYPYYVDFVERLGFTKECDWVQFRMDDWRLPERLEMIAERLQERYRLHFCDIDIIKKDKKKVMGFLQLYSDVFARSVYNFIPFTKEEMEEEAASCISMLRSKYCSILMDENNEIAGFGINFPSISKALQKARGRLFPFGWYHLLKAMYCKNDTADLMLNGTSAKWQGKGLSALYHKDVSKKFGKMGVRYSITNPQIETNTAVNVWETYNNDLFMRRRCFIKDL